MKNLGSAQIKREGWLFNYEGDTCPAMNDDLRMELFNLYIPWYLRPFKKRIHNIATGFWNSALILSYTTYMSD